MTTLDAVWIMKTLYEATGRKIYKATYADEQGKKRTVRFRPKKEK